MRTVLQNKTKALSLLLALLLSLGLFAGCSNDTTSSSPASEPGSSAIQTESSATQSESSTTQPESSSVESGQDSAAVKNITFKVVHGDGSTKEFPIETEAENLREALEGENLISGEEGEFGLFVKTVDGETADDGKQEWWCLTKSGETCTTGVDSTPIADGESYEFTLTTGY